MNKHKRHILRQQQQKQSRQKQAPLYTTAAVCSPVQTEAACIVIEESNCSVVPYDENLLERSRTQWQFGDWESLAQISRDSLQHHPDRAKLALLAAAGLLQKGENSTARQFVRLAQDWGCSKRLISQILVAGVYNSIGRAAVAGQQEHKALRHFENAITTGTPGSDVRLVTQARVNEQYQQLDLPCGNIARRISSDEAVVIPKLPPFSKSLETITETFKQQKAELDAQLKKQADDLIRVREFLNSSMKKEVANAAKQIESFIGMQNYFTTGELPNVNTESHSWPISPDFAIYLIELIELNDYDLIIEFGSGISTTIVAKSLAKLASKRAHKMPVQFISFEHLEQYYQQTSSQLRQAGLDEAVQLVFAPLQDWQAPNGNIYPYYHCQPTLAALAQKYPPTGLRLLAIVDGPPAATGKHARYPAGPLLLQHFAGAQLDILLDDYIRNDEKEIAQLWQTDIQAAGLAHKATERKLEKDACLISVYPSNKKQAA